MSMDPTVGYEQPPQPQPQPQPTYAQQQAYPTQPAYSAPQPQPGYSTQPVYPQAPVYPPQQPVYQQMPQQVPMQPPMGYAPMIPVLPAPQPIVDVDRGGGFGVLSLWLGILSIFSAILIGSHSPYGGFMGGLPMGFIGFITSIIALRSSRRKTAAVWGLILSIIGILAMLSTIDQLTRGL